MVSSEERAEAEDDFISIHCTATRLQAARWLAQHDWDVHAAIAALSQHEDMVDQAGIRARCGGDADDVPEDEPFSDSDSSDDGHGGYSVVTQPDGSGGWSVVSQKEGGDGRGHSREQRAHSPAALGDAALLLSVSSRESEVETVHDAGQSAEGTCEEQSPTDAGGETWRDPVPASQHAAWCDPVPASAAEALQQAGEVRMRKAAEMLRFFRTFDSDSRAPATRAELSRHGSEMLVEGKRFTTKERNMLVPEEEVRTSWRHVLVALSDNGTARNGWKKRKGWKCSWKPSYEERNDGACDCTWHISATEQVDERGGWIMKGSHDHTCPRDVYYEFRERCAYTDEQLLAVWNTFVLAGSPTVDKLWGYPVLRLFIPEGACTKGTFPQHIPTPEYRPPDPNNQPLNPHPAP